MYEKVNPAHPDKIADRIAGALVDLAYAQEPDPRIAVEVLLGHHKYAFRCFLLRLGFIGNAYKADRKILLRNLSGSSAFKSGKVGVAG